MIAPRRSAEEGGPHLVPDERHHALRPAADDGDELAARLEVPRRLRKQRLAADAVQDRIKLLLAEPLREVRLQRVVLAVVNDLPRVSNHSIPSSLPKQSKHSPPPPPTSPPTP